MSDSDRERPPQAALRRKLEEGLAEMREQYQVLEPESLRLGALVQRLGSVLVRRPLLVSLSPTLWHSNGIPTVLVLVARLQLASFPAQFLISSATATAEPGEAGHRRRDQGPDCRSR